MAMKLVFAPPILVAFLFADLLFAPGFAADLETSDDDCNDPATGLYEGCPLRAFTECIDQYEDECLPVVTNVVGELDSLDRVAMGPDRFEWVNIHSNGITSARPSDDPIAYLGWSAFVNIFAAIIRNPQKVDEKIEQSCFDLCGSDDAWNAWPPTQYLPSFQMAKKHLQSIQYLEMAPDDENDSPKRYPVTSISDETEVGLSNDIADHAAIQLIRTGETVVTVPHDERN